MKTNLGHPTLAKPHVFEYENLECKNKYRERAKERERERKRERGGARKRDK